MNQVFAVREVCEKYLANGKDVFWCGERTEPNSHVIPVRSPHYVGIHIHACVCVYIYIYNMCVCTMQVKCIA